MPDETKLPKWVRDQMEGYRRKIDSLTSENANLKQAHGLLMNRTWFTVQGPKNGVPTWQDGKPPKSYRLWMLDRDSPHPVCSLGIGDVLLVGRADKDEA